MCRRHDRFTDEVQAAVRADEKVIQALGLHSVDEAEDAAHDMHPSALNRPSARADSTAYGGRHAPVDAPKTAMRSPSVSWADCNRFGFSNLKFGYQSQSM